MPAHAEPDLRSMLAADEPFSAASIAGELDDEGRLVMVRRLVREGVLRISRANPWHGGRRTPPNRDRAAAARG